MSVYAVISWIVSLTAMLGSLYFSEIVQFFPCKLCWIQRIFMYPLVILIPVGMIFNDRTIKYYCLSLAIPGMSVSAYHYILQWDLFGADTCSGIACATRYVEYFGFVTIPFLSLVAFSIIFILGIAMPKKKRTFQY